MKVSPEGRKEIAKHEGNELEAYQDIVGVWTIGVGHTAAAGGIKPVKGMRITMAESDAILAQDLRTFEKAVLDAVKVPLTQNQFDALVSLAFNIGGGAFAKSTLVKRLNEGDYERAAAQFLVWNKAGGKAVKGLTNRRLKEKAWFEKDSPKVVEEPVKAPEKPVEPVEEVKAPEAAPVAESPLVRFLKALRSMLK